MLVPDLDVTTAFAINAEARRVAFDDVARALKQELMEWLDRPMSDMEKFGGSTALQMFLVKIREMQNA